MYKKLKQAQLSGDLDKNLIQFVTLWVCFCDDLHWSWIMGQPLAVILLSFLPLSIIYTSQEWKRYNATLCVCVYVSRVFLSLSAAVNNAPILLYCSLIQVTWSQWKAEAPVCWFQKEIERYTSLCLKACWWRKYKHRSTRAKVTHIREGAAIYIYRLHSFFFFFLDRASLGFDLDKKYLQCVSHLC